MTGGGIYDDDEAMKRERATRGEKPHAVFVGSCPYTQKSEKEVCARAARRTCTQRAAIQMLGRERRVGAQAGAGGGRWRREARR